MGYKRAFQNTWGKKIKQGSWGRKRISKILRCFIKTKTQDHTGEKSTSRLHRRTQQIPSNRNPPAHMSHFYRCLINCPQIILLEVPQVGFGWEKKGTRTGDGWMLSGGSWTGFRTRERAGFQRKPPSPLTESCSWRNGRLLLVTSPSPRMPAKPRGRSRGFCFFPFL